MDKRETLEEWGPWIDHHEAPQPVADLVLVQCEMNGDPSDLVGPYPAKEYDWFGCDDAVTRYRIRKPRGLQILEELIANIDAPMKALIAEDTQ